MRSRAGTRTPCVAAGYTVDRADNLITSSAQQGPFGQGVTEAVLRELGVRDQFEFVRVDDTFHVAQYPDFELAVPCGREPFLESTTFRFSQGRQPNVMTLATRMTARAAAASSHRRRELLTAARCGSWPPAGGTPAVDLRGTGAGLVAPTGDGDRMFTRRFGQGAGEVRATRKAVIWVFRKCPRQDRVKGGEVDMQVR